MNILLLFLLLLSAYAGRLRSVIHHNFPYNFPPTPLQRSAIKSISEEKKQVAESSTILETIMQSNTPEGDKTGAEGDKTGKTDTITNKLTFLEWPKGKAWADPCKESSPKLTPNEIKSQGMDIAENDKLRKYNNPCKPPPFLQQEELQPPGLPAIPVPPPLEMPR